MARDVLVFTKHGPGVLTVSERLPATLHLPRLRWWTWDDWRVFHLQRYAVPLVKSGVHVWRLEGADPAWQPWCDRMVHETPDGSFVSLPVYVEQ
jgi:hypothetical protein